MSTDNFEQLEREQITMRRDLAAKLAKGGPRAQARGRELTEQADRMEHQINQRAMEDIQPLHQWRPIAP